jgi:hypothetical protein
VEIERWRWGRRHELGAFEGEVLDRSEFGRLGWSCLRAPRRRVRGLVGLVVEQRFLDGQALFEQPLRTCASFREGILIIRDSDAPISV